MEQVFVPIKLTWAQNTINYNLFVEIFAKIFHFEVIANFTYQYYIAFFANSCSGK